MAIAFIGGTSIESTGSVTSTTVTLPSSLTAGDYTIIFISVNASSANITTPSGWTDILPDTNSVNGSTSMAHAIFYRKWQSGDTNPAITHSSGRACATPVRVTGADANIFVNTAAVVTQAASGATTIVAPTITPSSTMMVCSFAGRDANNGDVLDPWVNLSAGLTKIADSNGRAVTQTNAGHCIAYDSVTANVATGTRQADAAQPTTGAFGVSFALNEAGASGNDLESDASLSGSGSLVGIGVYGSPDTTFDDGTFEDWTEGVFGDGDVEVLSAAAHDGAFGIRGTSPTPDDQAALTKSITPTQQAEIAGWWRVTTEGASGSNVPFARMFYGTDRLVDVYRQNVVAGSNVWLRVRKAIGGSNYWFIATGYRLELNEWAYVEMRWNLDGTPLVKINGTTYLDAADTPADWFAAPQIDTVYLGSHESGNAGVWEIDTVRVNTFLASAALSSSGTLVGTITPGMSQTASFSGSGTLTASSVVGFNRNAAFSGSGTLTSSRTVAFTASPALSGEGLLEAVSDVVGQVASVNLSGTGTLSKAVVANFTASMSSSGTGTLVVSEVHAATQAVGTFTGSGTLTSSNVPAITKAVSLGGTGTLSTTQDDIDIAIGVDVSGEGTLTATTSNSFTRDVALSGTGTLSATMTGVTLNASAALSGSGTLTGGTTTNKSITANLSASGTLAPFLTSVGVSKTVPLSGSGTLSATSVHGMTAQAAFFGSGTLTRSVKVGLFTTCDRDGFGTLVGSVSTVSHTAAASFSAVGTLLADTADRHDYVFDAYLADKRWNADVGTKRWEGSL